MTMVYQGRIVLDNHSIPSYQHRQLRMEEQAVTREGGAHVNRDVLPHISWLVTNQGSPFLLTGKDNIGGRWNRGSKWPKEERKGANGGIIEEGIVDGSEGGDGSGKGRDCELIR